MKKLTQRDDELWNSFKSGNHDSFAHIYQLYYKALYSYGKKFAVDSSRTEDAIQDLFINLWRTRENLSPVNNIKYYLFRSLRREIHRQGEKEKRFEKVDIDELLDAPIGSWKDTDLSENEDELARNLAVALQKLPRRQYEVIMLRYFEDFSVPEISSIMDISEKTVRNTLFNAISLLRQSAQFLSSFVKILLCNLLTDAYFN